MKFIKNVVRGFGSLNGRAPAVMGLTALLGLASGTASAALPAEAVAAFNSVAGAVTDVLAALWPIVGAVIAGFVTIKLVKRGSNKV